MEHSKITSSNQHVPRGRRTTQAGPHGVAPMEPLMTTTEVAEFLGIPVQTVYAWRTEGKGPKACRIGKHLRFFPDDVRTWALSQRAA